MSQILIAVRAKYLLARRFLCNAQGLKVDGRPMDIPGAREGTTHPGSRPPGGGSLCSASSQLYEYICTGPP
jgi:hypothetical protein